MPYVPSGFRQLLKNTQELEQSFYRISKRFVPMFNYATLREKTNQLFPLYDEKFQQKSWFAKTTQILTVTTSRLAQIECITELLGLLPEPHQDTDPTSQLILMGALIYRLKRIEASCQGMLYGFFTQPEGSELYNLINNRVLQITPENPLDSLTVQTCCDAFHRFLKQKQQATEEAVARKIRYIDQDEDFFKNLEDIIQKAKQESAGLLTQVQYIRFIESVAKIMATWDASLEIAITGLNDYLKQGSSVSKEVILAYVCREELSLSPTFVSLFDEIISVKEFQKFVEETKAEGYESELKHRLEIKKQYALLGAYVLVMTKLAEEMPSNKSLIDALKHAIGLRHGESLDRKQYFSLMAFEQFLSLPLVESALKVGCWGNIERLKQSLAVQLIQSDEDSSSQPSQALVHA